MATITLKDAGDELRIIAISGYMDNKGTEKVEQSFAAMIDGVKNSVVVDLSDVAFLSSLGIRMLVAGGKTLTAAGGRMALLVGTNAVVIKTLQVIGVKAIIPMFEKIEEAEAALKS